MPLSLSLRKFVFLNVTIILNNKSLKQSIKIDMMKVHYINAWGVSCDIQLW